MKRPLNASAALAVAVALAAGAAMIPVTGLADLPVTDWVGGPAQGPPARIGAAMAFDSARARTVLFGGSDTKASSFDSDTWEFDGTAWSEVSTSGPSARVFSPMVFDSARGVSVLFGGYNNTDLADTWEWNGATWTQRVTAHAPPARVWPGMIYDSNRHVTVLFGGQGAAGALLADTWEYDGTDWRQVTTAHAPDPRMGMGLAFDSARGRTVLFGGRTTVRLNDTWEYDGADWTQIAATTPPPPRFWHSMAYDAALGRVVVFGGDYIIPFAIGPNNETWLYDGTGWQQLLTTDRPSPRVFAPVAYDSARSSLVMFGGDDEVAPDVAFGDTQSLQLIGTAPVVGIVAVVVRFPQEPVLSTSSQPLSLTNTGNSPLALSSIATSGAFGETDGCPRSPATLAPGAACTINVSFTPTTGNGTQVSGSLTLSDNAGTGTQSIPLYGSGFFGFLQVSPASIDFGTVSVAGGTPASSVETLTFPAQPTVVTGVEAAPPFAVSNLDCPLGTALSSGATCHLQVSFNPTAAGTYNGQLVIHDDEPGLVHTVPLTGTAVALPPVSVNVQLTFGGASFAPTFAHTLNVLAITNAASGTATFTFNGRPAAGPVALSGGSASASIMLDDSLIPSGAGTYPLVVSIQSTDPLLSDSAVTQEVTVLPAPVKLSFTGTGLAVSGTPAVLSAAVAPPVGETQFFDFSDHPVWVRFDVTDSSGTVSSYFAQVADVTTPAGYSGKGTASAAGPTLAPGPYSVRARLVAGSGSAVPCQYVASEDFMSAYAAEPVRGGYMAGADQESSVSVAFDFSPGSTPSGGLMWVQAVQVLGSDGLLHDAWRIIASTSVTSVASHSHTATATGQATIEVVDATSGARYPALDQVTNFQVNIAADGSASVSANGNLWSGTMSPGAAVNHL